MSKFISNDVKLDFGDVQIVPNFGDIDSRSKVKLSRQYVMPISGDTVFGSGIIAANMDGVGTFEVADVLSKFGVWTALHKNYSVEELVQYFNRMPDLSTVEESTVFYSMGLSENDYNKLNDVKKKTPINFICIDAANGYMDSFYEFIGTIRDENPFATIMAGNVVTPEAVEKANKYGADIVKLGIGPGAMCTTRLVTGVGYPQLSCILDSVQAADECGIYLCSDGGCVEPGDVSKALVAGADFVMLGSMLAGTDEGGGDVIDGRIQFYGMSSKTANDKHFGGLKDYRSSEGRTTMIPYKGTMEKVITHILGGVRSSCTYTGSKTVGELAIRGNFIRVNNTHNRSYEQHTIGY